MAKNAVKEKPETQEDPKLASSQGQLATQNQQHQQVAEANLMDEITGGEDMGLSKDAADNMVPLIYLLQSGSPQVKPGEPARIDGAEQGDIWLRGAEKQIIKGSQGIVFQPCYFYKELVEWMPDRGGYVARHDITLMETKGGKTTFKGDLADVKEVPNPQDATRKIFARPNGNTIVETRCFAGYVHEEGFMPMPFIINLSSTGHTFAKNWMFQQNSQQWKGKPVTKSWVFLWRLKTTLKKNTKGSWYMYSATKERMIGNMDKETADQAQFNSEYMLGKTLYDAMLSGAMKAEAPIEQGDEATGNQMDDNSEM